MSASPALPSPSPPPRDHGIPDQAVLRVVAGDATEEEVVALVTALAAAAGRRGAAGPPVPASRWAERAALLRAPLGPGPGAWQAAAWRR